MAVLAAALCFGACGDEPPGPVDDAGIDALEQDGGLADASEDASSEDARPDTHTGIDSSDEPLDQPDVGVDVGADSSEEAGDSAADATEDSPPIHNTCGDGWRDTAVEECDDGLDSDAGDGRACSSSCTVVEHVVAAAADVKERRLGAGRHPVAGNDLGHSACWVEVVETDAGTRTRLGIATYSPVGERRSEAFVDDVLYDADPVVAALPDGTFAVAFSSLEADCDGLGVGLMRFNAAGESVGAAQHANQTTFFGQHSPDVVWTGTDVTVGWEDDSVDPRVVCKRRFSADLVAIGAQSCWPASEGPASKIVLASMAGGLVAAWQEESLDDAGLPQATVFVDYGSGLWASDPMLPMLPGQKVGLAALDAQTLLLVIPSTDGVLRANAIDVQGGDGVTTALNGPDDPRASPALEVTPAGVYLAWTATAGLPDGGWDPQYDDLWIQKLVWTGVELDTTSPPIPLPRSSAGWAADQRRPALVAVPYWPDGAVFAAWEDLGSGAYPMEAEHGDVIVTLLPTPILRGDGALVPMAVGTSAQRAWRSPHPQPFPPVWGEGSEASRSLGGSYERGGRR